MTNLTHTYNGLQNVRRMAAVCNEVVNPTGDCFVIERQHKRHSALTLNAFVDAHSTLGELA